MMARHGSSSRRAFLARAFCAALTVIVAALWLGAGNAGGSVILARDARAVRLAVDERGRALVTYRDAKGIHRVLVWGAINDDLRFKLDYSGGLRAFGEHLWKDFRDVSRPYTGPDLPWLVVARRARDGSFWALQAWQRLLPNLGYTPWKHPQAAWELHVSHWRGPLPLLEIWLDWVRDGRFEHLFGRYTYRGKPVFGMSSTPDGRPLDPYGRNIYLDTYDSVYGPGWERENSFLTHEPNGNFCYGFYPHTAPSWYPPGPDLLPGVGSQYRATVIGPGVTPDVSWAGQALGPFDPVHEERMNELSDQIAGGDQRCRRH
jgi:hypothetical protein